MRHRIERGQQLNPSHEGEISLSQDQEGVVIQLFFCELGGVEIWDHLLLGGIDACGCVKLIVGFSPIEMPHF